MPTSATGWIMHSATPAKINIARPECEFQVNKWRFIMNKRQMYLPALAFVIVFAFA